jgi:bifunctional DNA-binding transcriptional regulator/antitoxin component of YhaV-PrlF toxin-antitoxin module
MTTKISGRGRITLPANLRVLDEIKAGEQFTIKRINRGEYRLSRCEPVRNIGLVDWLLKCPMKGYFVPIESESTDTIG